MVGMVKVSVPLSLGIHDVCVAAVLPWYGLLAEDIHADHGERCQVKVAKDTRGCIVA